MADHLMLAEGYRLVQRPPPGAPSHGPHALRTLQPYAGPGLDSGLRPRGTPLGPPPPPPPGALAYGPFGPPPALGCMDAELIDEEALTSLELELGLHRVRELPELFLGQSEFDCFSDLGSAPPAGSVSC
ncbi:cbp/p300-interacting transactivator 4 [Herpailurus yagouaroundi]|uniref:cbp/p300-interacting transactivator 4 n=1 Tax=Herpailurus yagouaroundi TaxID=1608482 RepID=UPI001AD6EE30|nr:cbp/p300-interacting transactivator 4 [Puma yagouaroundi]